MCLKKVNSIEETTVKDHKWQLDEFVLLAGVACLRRMHKN